MTVNVGRIAFIRANSNTEPKTGLFGPVKWRDHIPSRFILVKAWMMDPGHSRFDRFDGFRTFAIDSVANGGKP